MRSRRSRGASLRGPTLKKSPTSRWSAEVTEHARCGFPTDFHGPTVCDIPVGGATSLGLLISPDPRSGILWLREPTQDKLSGCSRFHDDQPRPGNQPPPLALLSAGRVTGPLLGWVCLWDTHLIRSPEHVRSWTHSRLLTFTCSGCNAEEQRRIHGRKARTHTHTHLALCQSPATAQA